MAVGIAFSSSSSSLVLASSTLAAAAAIFVLMALPSPAQSHTLVRRGLKDEFDETLSKVGDAVSRGNNCMPGWGDSCYEYIEECHMAQCKFQTWFVVTVIVVPIVLLIFLLISCLCCPCCCLYNMCRKR